MAAVNLFEMLLAVTNAFEFYKTESTYSIQEGTELKTQVKLEAFEQERQIRNTCYSPWSRQWLAWYLVN